MCGLERIYLREDMEDDSGVDSKQDTLSTTSTNSVSLRIKKIVSIY